MKVDFHPDECVDGLTQLIAEDRDAAEFFSRVGLVDFVGDGPDDWREAVRTCDEADLNAYRSMVNMSYESAVRVLEAKWAEEAPRISEMQTNARAMIARAEAAKQARLAAAGQPS